MAIVGYTNPIPPTRAEAYGATRKAGSGAPPHSFYLWPSRREAKRAYRRYLIAECGYEARENVNELKGPDGYVLVLARDGQFGGEVRTGKQKRPMFGGLFTHGNIL